MRIGIVSDTHGLLRPEVIPALANVDHILHAGDIGDPHILHRLKHLAPVTAIRGNVDVAGPCAKLPATEAIELSGHLFYMVHSLSDLDLNPKAAGMAAVINGHTHQPKIDNKDGVLYLNPGSCGPRRFKLPVSIAVLTIDQDGLHPELVELLPDA